VNNCMAGGNYTRFGTKEEDLPIYVLKKVVE
jgi:hypothetical protein